MSKVYMFFANGFEEVEALTVVDLLRRAGIEIKMVSITGEQEVKSSHNVIIKTDMLIEDICEEADMICLPGGMPGTNYLKESKKLQELINEYNAKGKYLAAICAAPTVYGEMGLLKGKTATCYPGMKDGLLGASYVEESVVVCDNFITSRGLGTAILFGLKIVEIFASKEKADALAKTIVYSR